MLLLVPRYPVGDEPQARGSNCIEDNSPWQANQRRERRCRTLAAIRNRGKADQEGNCGWLFGGSHAGEARTRRLRVVAAAALAFCGTLFAADPNPTTRVIQVHKGDIPTIYTQFGYNTVVILDGEQVTGQLSPDNKHWSFVPGDNFLLIKAKGTDQKGQGHPGQQTNVNVTTASGNVQTFIVQETSNSTQPFDLRVEIEQEDADSLAAIQHPAFVRTAYADDLKKQLDIAQQELANAKRIATGEEADAIRHDYQWKGKEAAKQAEEIGLKAIWHDAEWTYVESHTQKAPALYEDDGGKDSLVPYELHKGKYSVHRILDAGYFRIGKKKVEFTRVKESV